ncbi:TRAP transporter large permease [Flavonifractor hominis]|uniref:TRAP transporter large permease n=1 Tax=Flavonifractor hominis TaxID=3133178 RepID=A0ABV1ERT3_9FIRM
MNILILFVVMFALMFLGMNIFVAMGVSAAGYLLLTGAAPLTLVSQSMINGVANFSLLAIPFFMLTGDLMNLSGMTLRLVEFAKFFIGRVKGSLAYTCILVNMVVAGVSGSGPADCSAVSSVLLPAMEKDRYPTEFSAALNACAATMGPIIPPSIPMVFLAMLTNLSVGKLFMGGLIPGVLIGLAIFLICWYKTRKMPLVEVSQHKLTLRGFWAALREAWLSLIAPLIILVGVLTGLVTITEVSILAAAYVLFVGAVVYRTIHLKDILHAFKKAVLFSSTVMAMFSVVNIFSWIIAVENLGSVLGDLVLRLHLHPAFFLFLITLLFFFLGMVMDAIPAMTIFVPVLLPIAEGLGIDPVHFGVVVVVNLMIGLVTPPVGGLLFVEAKLSKVPFDTLAKNCMPFILAMISVLLLATYIPPIVTALPNLIF